MGLPLTNNCNDAFSGSRQAKLAIIVKVTESGVSRDYNNANKAQKHVVLCPVSRCLLSRVDKRRSVVNF